MKIRSFKFTKIMLEVGGVIFSKRGIFVKDKHGMKSRKKKYRNDKTNISLI